MPDEMTEPDRLPPEPVYADAYANAEPLKCAEFPSLARKIGVTVSKPFHHAGLKRDCVQVDFETITVNTRTFGSPGVAADNWKPHVREMTARVIADIDRLAAELAEHRARLQAELDGPKLR